jgi:hypothetical protein
LHDAHRTRSELMSRAAALGVVPARQTAR